jgi:methionyl aminopeptidase
MIVIKSEEDLRGMRAAGRVTAHVCEALAAAVGPGVTTGELDRLAGEWIAKAGGRSAFKGYRGFPGQICVSVNQEVVHGVPGPRRIALGDIVSLDVGVVLNGYVGDMAVTVMVGVTDPEVVRLVSTAEAALYAGIERARPGGYVGDISHAIEECARRAGYSVVREFVGHGIGRDMHEDPQVPNFGASRTGAKLRAGMTLAIEPMVNLGRAAVRVLEDGWTVVTGDGAPSAHFEHTVAVRNGEAEILTRARP